jgi:predicted transcriptional regulator
MSNITLAIDDEIVRKVRKLAVERNTSLTGLVRATLSQLASREDFRTEELIRQLDRSFDECRLKVGEKTWSREDLHAR